MSNIASKIRRGTDLILGHIGHMATKRKVEHYAKLLQEESPNESPYYSHQRQGQFGENFTMVKLRTMKSDPTGQLSSVERLTELGKHLRLKGIDEYTQFQSVIDGDMSFFGYRPRQPNCAESIPHCYKTLTDKPGITGLYQIYYAVTENPDEGAKRKIETFYANRGALIRAFLDVGCLTATVALVASKKGKADRSLVLTADLEEVPNAQIAEKSTAASISFIDSANPNNTKPLTRKENKPTLKAQAGFIDLSK